MQKPIFYSVAIAVCCALIGIKLVREERRQSSSPVEPREAHATTPHLVTSAVQTSASTQMAPLYLPHSDRASFTDSEREKVALVQSHIGEYLRWGRVDSDKQRQVRAILIELGDRIIDDVSQQLMGVSSDNVDAEDAARELIDKLDLLAYLAVSNAPAARESIRRLATRTVEWGNDGKLRDQAAAAVTFEAFDVFARLDPDAAAAHAAHQPEAKRRGYIVHYVYGRRLAGRPDDEIESDIVLRFGPRWSALAAE